MMTVLVITFLLYGQETPQTMAFPFDPYVTVADCRAASGPAFAQLPDRIQMLGWTCVSFPFTKANAA